MLGALIFIGVVLAAGGVVLWCIGAAIGGLSEAYYANRHAKRMAEFDAWDKANPEAAAYGRRHAGRYDSGPHLKYPDD